MENQKQNETSQAELIEVLNDFNRKDQKRFMKLILFISAGAYLFCVFIENYIANFFK
ncbi:MAG: hypothetical protein V1928_02730 [Parcubacteria group bacterium]